jgi:hypothetical protein
MTVEILKVKKSTLGYTLLLVKEPDGVFRCWSVGVVGESAPCDELGAIRMFREEWVSSSCSAYRQDLEYREERATKLFSPEDQNIEHGLVVFD